MKTDDLIADLASRLAPVRPLPSPGRRAAMWLLVALACAATGVACFGARPDVMTRLMQPDYLWTAILAVTVSTLAAVATLVLAIPGAAHAATLRRVTVVALALWATTMVWAVVEAGRGLPIATDRHWPACFARVVVISVVPTSVLFAMARQAAPLRVGWTAALAAIAAASMAALAVQLVCPLDDAGHAFLGHFLPVLALAATGLALRRTLVRRSAA